MVQWEDVIDEHAVHVASKPYWYLYSSNQLQLSKGFTFTATAWIITAQNQGIFHRRQQYSVDFSLSRVFFKKLTCTINAFDIFRSLNYVESYNFNGISNSTTFLENQKEYSLSIKYSIGTLKDARYKSREVNENSNRLN